jgi:DtxR family Mn-dependent transcriptional regulator
MNATAHTATVDRYLETIYYIAAEGDVVRPSRLSNWIGVSAPTVSEALRRLERDGWIAIQPDRSVVLTSEGERVASSIVRRHRVLERWLTDVLGFDWAAADLEAERIASSISDEVIARIDESMGTPTTCPHGNAIPGRDPHYGALISLDRLDQHCFAHVRRISEVAEHEGQQLLQLLAHYGVGEGVSIELVGAHSDGGFIVAVGEQQVQLSSAAASAIWVEPVGVAGS